MNYVEADAARAMSGMRLALTRGVPNPFGEAAKAILRVKGMAYTPVAQHAGQPNEVLRAWTGHRNAPVAVYDDLPACARWSDILMLAERVAPEPSLLPADSKGRVEVFGIGHEICGEDGFAWNSRLLMFSEEATQPDLEPGSWAAILQHHYGGSPATVARAPDRCRDVLRMLAERLRAQRKAGSAYLVGEDITAADLWWATLSMGVVQLPDDWCDSPRFVRRAWQRMSEALGTDAVDPILIEHRDDIWRKHLELPVDF